ncbi:MAG: glycosyltransferase family 2 protein [Anaerolineae bacterium]
MASLSVVILTFNEEANIEACLESVKWADEIIIVDSGSTDATCELARRYTDKVVFHPWSGFAEQRNYGRSLASGEWILDLDADERITPALRAEIQELLQANSECLADGYRIYIQDWMFGKFVNYGSWPHQDPIRLSRAGTVRWQGTVHERAVVATGRVDRLRNPILHYSHITITAFLNKMNRYTDQEAAEMFEQDKRANLLLALLGAIRAFGGQYVRLQGFRDGGHGLVLAVLMAIYYFVLRAKLWSLWYMHDHNQAGAGASQHASQE